MKAHFQEDVHILQQPKINDEKRTTATKEELRSAFVWYGFQLYLYKCLMKISLSSLDDIECYQMYPDMGQSGYLSFGDDEVSNRQGRISMRCKRS